MACTRQGDRNPSGPLDSPSSDSGSLVASHLIHKTVTSSGTLLGMIRAKGEPRWEHFLLIVLGAVFMLVFLGFLALYNPPYEKMHFGSGYSIEYPRSWIVEEVKGANAKIIRQQDGHAFVVVSNIIEPRLGSGSGRMAVTKEIRDEFPNGKGYGVEVFGLAREDTTASANGYIAMGTLQRSTARYNFTELGLLEATSSLIKIRGQVLTEFAGELGPIVDEILLSLEREGSAYAISAIVTAENAKERVKNHPGVASYQSLLAESGGMLRLEVDDGGDDWLVRVFAPRDGNPELEMSAGRWSVNKSTGAITRKVL